MLNGVVVTFLASNQIFDWGPVEIGWLMVVPGELVFTLPQAYGVVPTKLGAAIVHRSDDNRFQLLT
jgi:NNP family nitrate/nitrite transporter-like MFS transporter